MTRHGNENRMMREDWVNMNLVSLKFPWPSLDMFGMFVEADARSPGIWIHVDTVD